MTFSLMARIRSEATRKNEINPRSSTNNFMIYVDKKSFLVTMWTVQFRMVLIAAKHILPAIKSSKLHLINDDIKERTV